MSANSTPERWLLVTVQVPEGELRELAIAAFLEGGADAFEETESGLTAAVPETPEGSDQLARLLSAVRRILPAGVEPSVRPVPHEDWAETWRRGLAPRKVSRRILVRPTWTDPPSELSAEDVEVVLDPGVAFGTAEHETTRSALQLLDETVRPGEEIADLGSGTAILSIAAALLGARRVVAIDFDPFATGAARENIERNAVGETVQVVEEMLTPEAVSALGPLDGILANIQADVLHRLLPGIVGALEPGGWVILSGVLVEEAPAMAAAAERAGLSAHEVVVDGNWWTACFRSPHAGHDLSGLPDHP